jgi:hypothetical protein
MQTWRTVEPICIFGHHFAEGNTIMKGGVKEMQYLQLVARVLDPLVQIVLQRPYNKRSESGTRSSSEGKGQN